MQIHHFLFLQFSLIRSIVGGVGQTVGDTTKGATDTVGNTAKGAGGAVQDTTGGVSNTVTDATGNKQTAQNPLGLS